MKTRNVVMVCLFLLMSSPIALFAQENTQKQKPQRQRPSREQLQQIQCNQIIRTLALDDATAAKFTTTYNKYMEEMRSARNMNNEAPAPRPEKADKAPAVKPIPTDAEVEKSIKERFAQSRKVLDIREKYYNEFRKFLSPKQIQKMYGMEKDNTDRFRKEMNRRQGTKRPAGNRQMPPAPAPAQE